MCEDSGKPSESEARDLIAELQRRKIPNSVAESAIQFQTLMLSVLNPGTTFQLRHPASSRPAVNDKYFSCLYNTNGRLYAYSMKFDIATGKCPDQTMLRETSDNTFVDPTTGVQNSLIDDEKRQ